MALLELHDVSQAFFTSPKKNEAKIALDHLSLSIEEGEFVSLLGPSGCGKTVTLSIMAGFIEPMAGTASFKGEPITAPGPQRGVVFQEYSLFPWLSVEQNVVFSVRHAARANGTACTKEEARKRARAALATVGLSDVTGARPNTLSGGMKQRVAIARLLAMDSEVFLMDEPFSALDEQTRRALDEEIVALWKQRGKTVVFVTHNISEAILVSSRIVLFSGSPGRAIAQWDLPSTFDRDPRSAEFISLADEIVSLMPSNPCGFCLREDEGFQLREQEGGKLE